MADFVRAIDQTLGFEGGYANDPDDRGGETYCGIARKFHPNWSGWKTIDAHKQDPDFPHCLKSLVSLTSSIYDFYRVNYWETLYADEITSQRLANTLFDIAVNMGVGRAIVFLQAALNELGNELVVDKKLGPKTLGCLRKELTRDDGTLEKLLNVFRGEFYLGIIRKDNSQRKFLRGWLKRVWSE